MQFRIVHLMKGWNHMANTNNAKRSEQQHEGRAVLQLVEVPTASIFNFAKGLGTNHRKTLTESLELHHNYLKASDAAQRAIKLEFLLGYVMGMLNVNRDQAEVIIDKKVRFGANPGPDRPARSKEQQQAYDAARKMFSFHISRDDKRVIRREAVKQVRLSSEFKEAAQEFVTTFYEEVSPEAIEELIVMLQAYKKRLNK